MSLILEVLGSLFLVMLIVAGAVLVWHYLTRHR